MNNKRIGPTKIKRPSNERSQIPPKAQSLIITMKEQEIKTSNTRGRKREPIPKNPAYSSIIFMLAEQEDNAYGIVKRGIGKTPAAVWPQTQLLYKLGYLKKSDAKKNAYTIVPEKCIPEFTARQQELIDSTKDELNKIDRFMHAMQRKAPECRNLQHLCTACIHYSSGPSELPCKKCSHFLVFSQDRNKCYFEMKQ